MIVVSLSIKVALQKAFLQSNCLRRRLCLMAMLVIWQRDAYDMNGENVRSSHSIYIYDCRG